MSDDTITFAFVFEVKFGLYSSEEKCGFHIIGKPESNLRARQQIATLDITNASIILLYIVQF